MQPLSVAEAAALWDVTPGYLNTSSYGPPPRPAFAALEESLDQWRRGSTSWEPWAATVGTSRAAFAALLGVADSDVFTGVAVSQLLAPVAVAVPDGARVLVPDVEFTSGVFPFAAHAGRGVQVSTAPLEDFAEAIRPGVDLVSLSAVQSAGGEVADLQAVSAAARAVGTVVVLDATQAAGWSVFDPTLADVVVVGAYKWLCSPRGTAFGWLNPQLPRTHPAFAARMVPLAAGWFAGADVHGSYYGMPMTLAEGARRFDISPAWHSWVGTAPALQLLGAVGPRAIGEHNLALANAFLAEFDLPGSNSAIVSVPAVDGATARLDAAGIRYGMRAGRIRVAFHLYSTADDVTAAAHAIRG